MPKTTKEIQRITTLAGCYISVSFAMHAVAAGDSIESLPTISDQASELYEQSEKGITNKTIAPVTTPTIEETEQALQREQLKQARKYDLQQLQSDPLLFTKFLNSALAAQDMQTVKKLLPYYKAMSVNDPNLIAYADALVYRSEGKNQQAIEIYRSMLAKDPTLHPVRLDMAIAMRSDRQYVAAKEQLTRLKSENLPAPVLARIDREIASLDKIEDWKFNASVSYLYDDNLNGVPEGENASKFKGLLDPIEGHGLQVSVGANKRFNLPQNFYGKVGADLFAKAYWDESDYNDYLGTVSLGVGYDDAKNDVSLTPFVTRRFYDEQAYSTRKGVTFQGSRWFKPKLKMSATTTLSSETYDAVKDKNREADGLFLGINALYTKNATEYFYGGIGHYQHDVEKTNILTYDRNNINVGWGKEWKKGISTRTSLGYAQKTYEKPDNINYYAAVGGRIGDNQQDKITSVDLQVWKRDYTVFGLTPRLVISYDNTDSNFAYYDNREDLTGTVILTKNF